MSISIAENTIYNCDCIEFMKNIEDNYFDLTLTDFPYGIGESYSDFNDTQENLIELVKLAEPEIKRVSKFAMVTCGAKNIQHYSLFDYTFAILHPANVSFCSYGTPTWQPILIYGKDPLSRFKDKWTSTISNETSPKNSHPCPKPLKLWEKILLRGSANENDSVFDPFMGSGTTAIVSINQNRKFFGCEIDKTYYEQSVKRITEHQKQERLFVPQKEIIQDTELFP